MQILTVKALETALLALQKDMIALEAIRQDRINRTKQLATKRDEYTERYLGDQLAAVGNDCAKRASKLIVAALERANALIAQKRYWSRDSLLRRARLTPPPAPIIYGDDSYLMSAEKQLREIVSAQSQTISIVGEAMERLRWLEEFRAMDGTTFIETLQDAIESKDLGILYVAKLSLSGRSDSASEKLRREVGQAIAGVELPEAARSLEIISEAEAIRLRVQSLWETLQGPRHDLKTWVHRQFEELRDEEKRARLERTQKQAS